METGKLSQKGLTGIIGKSRLQLLKDEPESQVASGCSPADVGILELFQPILLKITVMS